MVKPQDFQADELTGFFKRRSFQEDFAVLLAKARSQPVEMPLSLALIDLDRFLRINDEYGHQAGDIVIIELAKVVYEAVGDDAVCARYGGDETAILFVGKEQAVFLDLEQIRLAMANIQIKLRVSNRG
jgi:diguanylate cyclase (GGDEF)-like protein